MASGLHLTLQPFAETISMMEELLVKNPRNGERIFPLLGGDEILTNPDHAHRRFVIDFGDMREAEARRWPDLMDVLEKRVLPERRRNSRERRRKLWWQSGEVHRGFAKHAKAKPRIDASL